MSDNQRAHPRHAAPAYRVTVADETSFRNGYLKDISAGGLFVWTESVCAVDELVVVELELPDGAGLITIDARVAHIREDDVDGKTAPVGMGVKFVNMTADISEKLAAVLEHYEAQELGDDDDELAQRSEESLERELEAGRRRLLDLRAQVDELQEEIESYGEDDRESRGVVEQLRIEVDALRNERDAGEAEVETIREAGAELRAQVQGYEQLMKQVAGLERAIAHDRATAGDYRGRLDELAVTPGEELVEARSQADALRGDIEQLRRRAAEVEDGWRIALEAETRRISAGEQRVAELEQRREEMAERTERDMAGILATLASVQFDRDLEARRAERLVQRRDLLQSRVDRLRSTTADLRRLLSSLVDEAKTNGSLLSDLDVQDIDALMSGVDEEEAESEAAGAVSFDPDESGELDGADHDDGADDDDDDEPDEVSWVSPPVAEGQPAEEAADDQAETDEALEEPVGEPAVEPPTETDAPLPTIPSAASSKARSRPAMVAVLVLALVAAAGIAYLERTGRLLVPITEIGLDLSGGDDDEPPIPDVLPSLSSSAPAVTEPAAVEPDTPVMPEEPEPSIEEAEPAAPPADEPTEQPAPLNPLVADALQRAREADRARKAIQAYKEALAVAPRHAEANAELGEIYLGEGMAKLAARHLRTAVKHSPERAPYWILLGRSQIAAEKPAKAADSLRRYLELAPDGPEADRARELLSGLE